MIKSRVSLAQVTSLGRSSVFACIRACPCVRCVGGWDGGGFFCQGRGHLKAGGGRREGQRTCDHLCDGGLGQGEVIVGGWEARVTLAV